VATIPPCSPAQKHCFGTHLDVSGVATSFACLCNPCCALFRLLSTRSRAISTADGTGIIREKRKRTNLKGSFARPNTYWSPLGLAQQKPHCSLHLPYRYSDQMPDGPDPTNTTWPLGPPVAPYMVGEGISPAALLAPVDFCHR
jgi:hypothetical protein